MNVSAARYLETASPAVLPSGVSQVSVTFEGTDRESHFLAGRYCAARAMRALDPTVSVEWLPRDPSGAARWPGGLTGSITHTAGFAAAAVARSTEFAAIGIDCEQIVPSARALAIAPVIASTAELAQAADARELDVSLLITLIFSAKETLYKCLAESVGRCFGYEAAALDSVDVRRGTFRLRLTTALGPHLLVGTSFEGRFCVDLPRVHTGLALPARVTEVG